MSRRCRPGIRARIIAGANRGTIVVVVRHYFGELLGGSIWPHVRFGWIVTSLGAPLQSYYLDTRQPAPPARTIVAEDDSLEPIEDDEPPADETDVPVERPTERTS